jgi:hypothetical protein
MATRRETEAMDRAIRWVMLDPHYEGKNLTRREHELMMLAIRCYGQPEFVESEINKRQTCTCPSGWNYGSGNAENCPQHGWKEVNA